MPQPSKPRVFVSYRREDSAGHAGRLYDYLVQSYGKDQVFMDLEAIPPGKDFVEVIDRFLDGCKVVIVVIGRQWAVIADSNGKRLMNPSDPVRHEVSRALAKGDVAVIPALVQGARMPPADELPDELRVLARRNAIELSDQRWPFDCERLSKVIVAECPPTESQDGSSHRDAAAEARGPEQEESPEVVGKAFRILEKHIASWQLLPHRDTVWFSPLPVVDHIAVHIEAQGAAALGQPSEGDLAAELKQRFEDLRDDLLARLGVRLPGVLLKLHDDIPAGAYVISIREVPVEAGQIRGELGLCTRSVDELEKRGILAEAGTDPATGAPASWVARKSWAAARRAGLRIFTPIDLLEAHLKRVLQRNVIYLLEVENVFDLLLERAPGSLQRLSEGNAVASFRKLLLCLLDERVPITNIAAIAEVFLAGLRAGQDLLRTLQSVRAIEATRRSLPGNVTHAHRIHIGRRFSDVIRRALIVQAGTSILALSPDDAERLGKAAKRCLGRHPDEVVVVRDGDVRRPIRKVLELEFPDVPVLAAAELAPDLSYEEAGELEIE